MWRKIKKIINNPSIIFINLSNNLYHKYCSFLYPNITSNSLITKNIGPKKRYHFYNIFFSWYPLFNKCINFNYSNQYKNSTKRNPDITFSSDLLNFKELYESGLQIKENFLDKDLHKILIDQMENLKIEKCFSKMSYDNETFFYNYRLNSFTDKIKNVLLQEISDISIELLGKKVRPKIAFQKLISGDTDRKDPNTILHIDRFVPSLKIFYFPTGVNAEQSPYVYCKGSHIIDKEHLEYYLEYLFEINKNQSNKEESLPFMMPKKYVEQYEEEDIVCPPNSLVFTLTNGLHRRKGFIKKGQIRNTFRLDLYNQISWQLGMFRYIKSKFHI